MDRINQIINAPGVQCDYSHHIVPPFEVIESICWIRNVKCDLNLFDT